MPKVHIQLADTASPLRAEDWASLWAELVRAGCSCAISGSPVPADGAMAADIVLDIIVSAVTSTRYANVLLKFYRERHRAKLTLMDNEGRKIVLENMSVQEAERTLNGPVKAIFDPLMSRGTDDGPQGTPDRD